jgi:hypothetical protein
MSEHVANRAYSAARETTWWLRSHSFLDRSGGPEATIFIVGSGRSGTTWIQEVLNRQQDHRVLFEPFNPRWVRAVRSLPEHPYLSERAGTLQQAMVVERVLAGRVRSPWVDQLARPMIARKRIVKDIRAHGLVGWAADMWPRMRIVYVLRHPLAVMASSSALNWTDRLDRRLRQSGMMDDHLVAHAEFLTSLRDPWERAVASWCVDNLVFLRTVDPRRVSLVVFEQAVTNPGHELEQLVVSVGQPVDDLLLAASEQPSRMSRADRPAASSSRVHGWTVELDPGLQRRAHQVIDELGLSAAFGEEPVVCRQDILNTWQRLRHEAHAVG